MTEVSAAMVKDLREKTGAGMMDCKRALAENNGDVEAAVDWLRKKGLSAAAKRAGRVASEGLVGVFVDGRRGAIVEVNSETDFVARNELFQTFARTVARLAIDAGGDLQRLLAMPYTGSGRNVADELTHLMATIGENMTVRRAAFLQSEEGVIASYVHSALGEGLGRIAVLVAMRTAAETPAVHDFGKKLAMHVAASSPASIGRDDVPAELLNRERAILMEQARGSGKPEAIIEKMVQGRLGKFFEDVCLLDQTYVIDGESKVGKAIEAVGKEVGQPITVTGFVRLALGEGIEKTAADSAAA